MGLNGPGWQKILKHSIGGAIVMGNWKARYNETDGSIDIEHSTEPGIPYIKTDEVFSGEKFYTEVDSVSGNLKIKQFPGWDEDVFRDGTDELDLEEEWDEDDGGEYFIDYLLNTTNTIMSYEYPAYFISDPIDLDSIGRHNDSEIDWTATVPSETVLEVYTSVYNPNTQKWSDWTQVSKEGIIAGLPLEETQLTGYKLRYKVLMTTNSTGETPELSQAVLTVYSTRHFRVFAVGVYKESESMTDSVTVNVTEELT